MLSWKPALVWDDSKVGVSVYCFVSELAALGSTGFGTYVPVPRTMPRQTFHHLSGPTLPYLSQPLSLPFLIVLPTLSASSGHLQISPPHLTGFPPAQSCHVTQRALGVGHPCEPVLGALVPEPYHSANVWSADTGCSRSPVSCLIG